jgi:copper(I)-binding protein
MKALILLLFIVALSLAKPRIVVEDAWVRAVPPVSTMSAAFMEIKNEGTQEDYLVGVSSPIAEVSEIHTTIMEGGMMKMRKLERVKIPAGESVEFKPGGKHIMLINLKRHPKPGDEVRLILEFQKSGKIEVIARVKGMNTEGHPHKTHH